MPGISTRNATNTQETIDSLNNAQKDNILGDGYSSGPPQVPSVKTSSAAPSVEQLNQMIDNLLARPGVQTYDTPNLIGNGTYGTVDSPQISHFTNKGGVSILGAGNVTGAGILIVEGGFTIVGTFNFKGLVLVRGEFKVDNDAMESWVSGNATIYGSVWTESVKLKVGGSAIVNYSSQALSLANQTGGGSALPAPMRVTSLADCSQLVAGTGGCP